MGVPDVLAVRARTDLDPWDMHCEFCRAHIAETLAAVTVPFTVEDITVVGLSVVTVGSGAPHLQVDGTGGGISWPVLIGRPPILVGDPAGLWMQRVIDQGNGNPPIVELVKLPAQAVGPGNIVTASARYRYDPGEALRILLRSLKVE